MSFIVTQGLKSTSLVTQGFGASVTSPVTADLVTEGWGTGQRLVTQWFGGSIVPPPTPVVPAVLHGGGGSDRHHHHGPSPLEKLLEWYKDRGRKRPEPSRDKSPKPAEKKPPEPAYVELELDVFLPRPQLGLSASVVFRHDVTAPEYEFDVRLARPSFALHHTVETDVPGAFAEYAAAVTLPFAGRGLLKRGLSAAWRRVKNDDAAVLGLLASMGEIDHDVAALLAMADE